MIRYDWIDLSASDGWHALEEKLDVEFNPKEVACRLEAEVNEVVQSLIVEHGYVDRDYRSTLYGYYAKKGREYRRDCVRLHFFDESVRFDPRHCDLTCESGEPRDHYYGYIVLRPTMAATLGRSLLLPRIRRGVSGRAIMSNHKVNLLGHSLSVHGFPSMQQPSDIAVCAHVSCWAILRHLSERYPQYPEQLLYDVTQTASAFDLGAVVPSMGLSLTEAERIFQAAGCYPLVVVDALPDQCKCKGQKEKQKQSPDFREEMHAYLESGCPLYVGFDTHSEPHAAALVGFKWRDQIEPHNCEQLHAWELVETLTMVDDNKLPYTCVPAGRSDSSNYTGEDLEEFIVALPEKVHFPASAVQKFCELYTPILTILFNDAQEDMRIRRYFLTTIAELRQEVRKRASELAQQLVACYMTLESAQYVWVVELCNSEQWNRKVVQVRAIVDASASPRDPVPMLLAHNGTRVAVFDRLTNAGELSGSMIEFDRSERSLLSRMELNLIDVESQSDRETE